MKAQERHELRENDLASWLHYGLWAFLKQNGSYILLILALGFLGVQIWRLYTQRVETARLVAWADYNNLPARDDLLDALFTTRDPKAMQVIYDAAKERPQRLREIIDAHEKLKPLRAACYLNMGDFYHKLVLIPELMKDMNLNRDEALEKSTTAYRGAIAAMPDDEFIAPQGQLGLASALEDQGEWEKALKEYKSLAEGKFAKTAFAKLAADRVASIEDRKKAPRLAAMIPLPAPPKPQPSILSPGGLNLKGLGLEPTPRPTGPGFTGLGSGLDFNPAGPVAPVTTAPTSAPAWQMNLGGPFNTPVIPMPPPATQP